MTALEQIGLFIQLIAQGVARLAELSAALIIAIAVLQALGQVLRLAWRSSPAQEQSKEALRLTLGRWLAIALEFLLAADIVLTAIAPTWDDIGKLGAVALIRTALNYFLQKEIAAHAVKWGKAAEENGQG